MEKMMDSSEIIKKMCHEELTQADIKAICKNRGFSLSEAGSPEILENFIVSDIGLDRAFAELSRKEIIALHLMKFMNKELSIDILRGLAINGKSYSSYNQRFGVTFKYAREKLIRKGLIAFCDRPSSYERMAKIERLVCILPPEFHKRLPGPFESPFQSDAPGELNETAIREKLKEILNPVSEETATRFTLNIEGGVLRMGKTEFKTDQFFNWRLNEWARAFKPSLETFLRGDAVNPLSAVKYAFSLLKPDEWIAPDELALILQVFCSNWWNPDIDVAEICAQGWAKGVLIRRKFKGKPAYRWLLDDPEMNQHSSFDSFLDTASSKFVRVDLQTIPIEALDRISRISFFRTEHGELKIDPDPVRMGRNLEMIRNDTILSWLVEKSETFRRSFQTLEKRWGKQIVHTDLLIARINHAGLKAALEKSFSNADILFLPDDCIAFPKHMLERVEHIVVRNGFAIKTIQHSKLIIPDRES